MLYWIFSHDQPCISQWIKSISKESDVTIHVITSQLSGHCDIISNQLWHHQQNENQARHGDDVPKSSFSSSFMDTLCCVRNKITYVLSWRTVSVCTRVLFWYLFPELEINTKKPSREHWSSSSHEYIHYSLFILCGYINEIDEKFPLPQTMAWYHLGNMPLSQTTPGPI